VHFGFAETLDISSDLYQLAASPVILVAAGIKPVLDVRATVEVLETLSVPTLGWHTDEVPTFYRRTGGPPVSSHVETAPDVAAVAAAHWALDLGGLLLLRPPDSEVDIEESLRKGLAAAGHQGVQGSDVTPFLLRWLDQETDEQTVEPHRQLLLGNARLAAEVAVALKPEAS
jgi:pseudouridine-5'-phosphate glycosidase